MYGIVARSAWGAVHGKGNEMLPGAKAHFVVHHDGVTRATAGSTELFEAGIMRLYEDYHAETLTPNHPRIGYSFVIFPSGRVYEGCGWGRIGAHTQGMNSKAYGVCHAINGAVDTPTLKALASQMWLRAEGIRLGWLTPAHVVSGHQDHGKPSCPGAKVYPVAVHP